MHNAGFGGWIVVIVIGAALLIAAAVVISRRANRQVGGVVRSAEDRLRK